MAVGILNVRVHMMVAFTLILLLTGTSVLHAGPRIKPGLDIAILDISGNFGAAATGGRVGAGSSADALGLSSETVFQPRLDVDWEKWHLWFIGFKADYSGTGTSQERIQLGNLPPITVNTPVHTDAGFKYLTANVIYDILPTKFVDIGIGLGGGLVNYDLAFQSLRSPLRVSTDDRLPFAFPMARIGKAFGRFEFVGSVAGIAVDFSSGHDISYFQAELGASYRIFGKEEGVNGYLTLGYRYYKLDYEYNDQGGTIVIDIDLKGPYLGFALSF